MLPDFWGSDYDYAEAHGNHETVEAEPVALTQPQTIAALREMTAGLVRRFNLAECSGHRCRHGINLERARCCQCQPLTETELGQ